MQSASESLAALNIGIHALVASSQWLVTVFDDHRLRLYITWSRCSIVEWLPIAAS